MKSIFVVVVLALCNTVFSQPVITSFSPLTAPPGAQVIIKGLNFGSTITSNIVYFGAARATLTAASDASVVAIVPFGATHSSITLTTGNLIAYSPKKFLIATGNVGSLTPTSFGTKKDFIAGDFVQALAVADFDGDKRVDIATANYSGTTISVFRNLSLKPNISLGTKINLPATQKPGDLKSADIDGDGKLDLVSSNDASKTISVFRNTSTPSSISFASKVDFPTGTYAVGVALGDIDGDGKTDIIETNNHDGTVSVLLNNGSTGVISFAPGVSFPTGSSPASVAVMDMDEDGKQDILVVNMYSNSVSLFKNTSVQGNVSMNDKIDFATDGQPYKLDVGDLDGDNKPDIVTGNSHNSTVSVLRNMSSGAVFNFSRQDLVIGTSPTRVAIDDVDGDGKPDISIGGSEMTIAVLKNTSVSGSITFAEKQLYDMQGSSGAITIADLDNDAKNDIIVGSFNRLSILRNRMFEPTITSFSPVSGGAGTVVTIKGGTFTGVTSVKFGNVEAASFTIVNDSTITATVGYGATGGVTVTSATGSDIGPAEFFYIVVPPVITSVTPQAGPAGSVVTIRGRDFGAGTLPRFVYFGAQKASIISANDTLITAYVPTGATYAAISVTKEHRTAYSPKPFNVTFAGGNNMFSSNTFGANLDSATGIRPAGIATGDFNSGGKTDIVVANSGSSSISVYRNLSDSTRIAFAPKTDFPAGINPQGVAVGDMDGDGKLDIAIANTGSNTVSFYKNYSTANNISFRDRFDVATPAEPFAIKLANLNTDGRPDIVVVCKGGMVSTLKNISGDNFIYYGDRIDSLVGNVPEDVAIADFDGDGKSDLAVRDSSSDYISVFRNTTTSHNITYAAKQRFEVYGNAGISAADLDADGKTDLVVSNPIGRRFTILRNESSPGNIAFSLLYQPTLLEPMHSAIADIDGDGKPDVAHSNYFYSGGAILRNSTSGPITFEAAKRINAGGRAQLALADLDGDNKPELIVSDYFANKLSILRNQTGEVIKTVLCPGGNTTISSNLKGASYKWQVDSGSGFIDITDIANYSGTNTDTLQLSNIPSSWYGFKYRCIVDGTSSEVFSLKFQNTWLTANSGNWESAGTWSCSSVPDLNTDVIIGNGTVTINSDVVVRSVKLSPGGKIIIAPGFTLTITK